MPDLEDIVASILSIIPNVRAIYVFGSFAKNQATEESDIDLAFFGELPYSNEICTELSLNLAQKFNKSFDCIDLKSTNTVFAAHIIDTGKLLFSISKSEVDFFEVTIFSMYVNLNEERKEIISDILKRGSIYG